MDALDKLLLMYGLVMGIPLICAGLVFLVAMMDHMKWLRQQEAYWDNMRKEREEKERMK